MEYIQKRALVFPRLLAQQAVDSLCTYSKKLILMKGFQRNYFNFWYFTGSGDKIYRCGQIKKGTATKTYVAVPLSIIFF